MIDKLQDMLTKEYLGIIWVTEGPLEQKPAPFFGLDYFLDGLLSKFLSKGKNVKNINLLFSKSFGHPFFLMQFQKNATDFKKNIQDIMNLVGSSSGPFNRILIIGHNGGELQTFLDSQFKKFTFDYFI
jgi:hypothetical protein